MNYVIRREDQPEKMKTNPDYPEITCEHGYFPYCPTCEHGLVIQEEWMQEDQCEWVCMLDNREELKNGKEK